MLNFTDALNKPVDEIERPPLLPMGTYRCMVEKQPAFDTIADGKWDVVDFSLRAIEAQPDVDQEELEAYGGLGNTRLRRRFMFNKEDQQAFDREFFNLKRFLTDHLMLDGKGKHVNELLAEALNQQCLALVRWRADKNDPEVQYAEINRTMPVE